MLHLKPKPYITLLAGQIRPTRVPLERLHSFLEGRMAIIYDHLAGFWEVMQNGFERLSQ